MYYDERVIGGRLHFRINPKGEWIVASGTWADLVNALAALPPQERDKAMRLVSRGF